jgi:hypothetical protein
MLTVTFTFPPGRPALRSSFSNIGTIHTAKEFLATVLVTSPDNISLLSDGSPLPDGTPLTRVPDLALLAVVNPSRIFRFRAPRGNPIDLPFRETALVVDAKSAISPKLQVFPEQIDLQVNGQSLEDDFVLSDLILPSNGVIDVVTFSGLEEDEITYLFLLQGEGHSLALKKSATVADAIQSLSTVAEQDAKEITLSFNGNPLSNPSQLLVDLRVPPGELIMAEAQMFRCVELRDWHSDRPLFTRPSTPQSGRPPPARRSVART